MYHLCGVGPIYTISISIITVVSIILTKNISLLNNEISALMIPLIIIGILFILFGIYLWVNAVIVCKLDDNIRSNKLVTTGVYAYVRNPIYSAVLLVCTGAIIIANNLYLLVLPVIYWAFLTVLMKNTEEKWLLNMYGDEYINYCKKVNRCIPFKRK
ncbi:MAG: isoprenylcysteine carboxylmethyltransferase family protein [Clostridia bacterium]|nr:isoprenylcysteine carboxylmethyltransferase family protein [Clostridia bacterium]